MSRRRLRSSIDLRGVTSAATSRASSYGSTTSLTHWVSSSSRTTTFHLETAVESARGSDAEGPRAKVTHPRKANSSRSIWLTSRREKSPWPTTCHDLFEYVSSIEILDESMRDDRNRRWGDVAVPRADG